MNRLDPAHLVPTWHRNYVRSHPIGLFVALGIGLGGFFGLFLPDLVRDSAASVTLPNGVLKLFYVVWLVGGTVAFVGLLRGILRLHVSGMALIAGGLQVGEGGARIRYRPAYMRGVLSQQLNEAIALVRAPAPFLSLRNLK